MQGRAAPGRGGDGGTHARTDRCARRSGFGERVRHRAARPPAVRLFSTTPTAAPRAGPMGSGATARPASERIQGGRQRQPVRTIRYRRRLDIEVGGQRRAEGGALGRTGGRPRGGGGLGARAHDGGQCPGVFCPSVNHVPENQPAPWRQRHASPLAATSSAARVCRWARPFALAMPHRRSAILLSLGARRLDPPRCPASHPA
jgi:hypothetical protein